MFQTHIHRLRGIAILFVVALHCVSFFSWQHHPLYYKFLRELFDNSTVVFIFISGFLFQHLSARFTYGEFLRKKFTNVILPYLILAIPAIAYVIIHGDIANKIDELHGTNVPFQIAWLYIYAGAHINYALWYIPVITIYYLAAPLLIAADRKINYAFILVPLIAISVLGHRPTYTHGHNLQLALYFLSCYALGMFFSHYQNVLDPIVRRYLIVIFGFYTAIFTMHFLLIDHGGMYQVDTLFSFEHGFIDWIYLQKILLSIFFLGFLRYFDSIKIGALDYLAGISFSIYFVHLYVLFILHAALHWVALDGTLTRLIGVYALTLLSCCAFASGGRRLFGHRSRNIIGS